MRKVREITTLRGDVREADRSVVNRLRSWKKNDVSPRPDDLLHERLYCIQWMRLKRGAKRREYDFRAVSDADLERERVVEQYVTEHWEEWTAEGWIPDMKIEEGGPPRYQGRDLFRSRGWTHWQHVFTPRQLLLGATINRQSSAPLKFGLTKVLNRNSRLSHWHGGRETVEATFYNQALNTRALEKQRLLLRDDQTPSLDLEPADGFEQLLGAAVHYRIAVGPHAGRKALTLYTVATRASTPAPCIAQLSGCSLHAGTVCHPHQRDSLERLCRYIARPALSNERLSVNERGQVVYRLKHPFRDGTTHVVLDPLDFIARLAALVPRPRAHLTRYHGVFAPNFRHRNHIVPHIAHQGAPKPPSPTPPMNWMQRLKRVFHLDIEHCPLCGGTLRVIACIEAPDLIERILAHLAAREADSVHRPRAPPPSASRAELLASPSLVIS